MPDPAIQVPEGGGAGAELDNATFRDRAIAFVRQVAAGGDKVTCDLSLSSKRPFRAVVMGFQEGKQIARGEASDAGLCVALKEATRRAVAAAGGAREALAGARLVVELPDHHESMVESVERKGKGVELTQGLVPVRALDKALLAKRIEDGKGYLLRVIDPLHKGVHKYYHAPAGPVRERAPHDLHRLHGADLAEAARVQARRAPAPPGDRGRRLHDGHAEPRGARSDGRRASSTRSIWSASGPSAGWSSARRRSRSSR